MYNRKHTEETKEKIRQKLIGYKHPKEFSEKMSRIIKGRKCKESVKQKFSLERMGKNNPMYGKIPWNKGIKTNKPAWNRGIKSSDMTVFKMRLLYPRKYGKDNPFYNKKHTEESKEKIRQKLIGRKHTLESRKKISLAVKGWKMKEEQKKILSETRKLWGNPAWRGGLSFLPYSLIWSKELRLLIRQRDSYICQLCGNYGNTVHHIDYNKQNCKYSNLITLCKSCHSKTNINREFWEKLFINYLNTKKEVQNGNNNC